jgi:hypothetical protein
LQKSAICNGLIQPLVIQYNLLLLLLLLLVVLMMMATMLMMLVVMVVAAAAPNVDGVLRKPAAESRRFPLWQPV